MATIETVELAADRYDMTMMIHDSDEILNSWWLGLASSAFRFVLL